MQFNSTWTTLSPMASSPRVTSCRFLRLGCRNDQHELFSASYARSNKKRNAKLLRCFPHCCPGHIERSYCGSSLHMLVTFESDEDAATANEEEDVVVCARFEAAADVALPGVGYIVTPLPLGSITALPSCALRPGGSAVESDWVLGEKVTEIYQQQIPKWIYQGTPGIEACARCRHWLAALSPFAQTHHHESSMRSTTASELIANLASKFSLAQFIPDTVQLDIVANDPVREQRVLQLSADLLLDTFSSSRIRRTFSQAIVGQGFVTQGTMPSSGSCEQFCQLVADFIEELTGLLQAQISDNGERTEDSVTVLSLVDEILSLIYGETKYQSLRETTSSLLLRRDESLEITVQALYRSFQQQRVENRPLSISVLPHSGVDTFESSRSFSRPSLLSVITLLRMFASVDISIECSRVTVVAAMASVPSGTELILDGQPHTIDTLPNGLSSVAGATLLVFAVLAASASATVDHDKIEPFPQPEPVTVSEKAAIKFKPQLYTAKEVCVPFPAVNAAGEVTGGLKGTNGNDACKYAPKGAQVYGRAGWYKDVWAIMYSWYFPKGFNWLGFPSRRHDWKNVVVWIDNPDLEIPKIVGVAMSKSDTKYWKELKIWPSYFVGYRTEGQSSRRVEYYGSNMSLRFEYYASDNGIDLSRWDGEYQDLIMWEQLTDAARVALNNSDSFGNAEYQGFISDDGSSIELLLVSLPSSFSSRILSSWDARRMHLLLELDETRGRGDKGFIAVVEVSSAFINWNESGHPSTDEMFDSTSTWRWSPMMEVHATYKTHSLQADYI
ncbi:hypothetical protein P3T76_009001 [Phytophthora citrophthora]|uniref:Uncharacterized protein n=1 Tax=Phytophthora citrophthora TaxID=4793 RepID=A0AAD9GIY6_9STRA|nr:hypothetical protein P3T76_009001 [Phytophthora citrophthora]